MKLSSLLTLLAFLLTGSLLRADFATDTIEQINLVRAKEGLSPLAQDPHLSVIAQEWAAHLAERGGLIHRSRDELKGFLGEYGWHGMNENLHGSTATMTTPAFVVDSWMHSPAHHDNLLRPRITLVGIGAKTKDGMTYVVFNGAF